MTKNSVYLDLVFRPFEEQKRREIIDAHLSFANCDVVEAKPFSAFDSRSCQFPKEVLVLADGKNGTLVYEKTGVNEGIIRIIPPIHVFRDGRNNISYVVISENTPSIVYQR